MKDKKLFEKDASSLKDGGFIFQAIISHKLSFDIKDGYVYLSAGTTYPFDKSRINATLHQVDLFPDLKTSAGTATLTYVILSEVNNLARKFELAAEVIKRMINPFAEVEAGQVKFGPENDKVEGGGLMQINPPPPSGDEKVNILYNKPKELEVGKSKMTINITPPNTGGPNPQLGTGTPKLGQGGSNLVLGGPKANRQLGPPEGRTPIPPMTEAAANKNMVKVFYKDEVEKLEKAGKLTRKEMKRLNEIFFKGTFYKVDLNTKNLHLREISTSGLDGGSPDVILKISTSLRGEAFGGKVPSLENFTLTVSGSASLVKKGKNVALLSIFDSIEKKDDLIFQTILPSLVLKFETDKVPIETFSNKSSEIAGNQSITYDSIFKFDKTTEEEKKLSKFNKSSFDTLTNSDEEKVVEDISRRIKYAESKVKYAKHKDADQIKNRLDILSKKLVGAKKIYESLGKSLYIKQDLSSLLMEVDQFYQQFSYIF